MTIRHFMIASGGTRSAGEFLSCHPQLPDSAIMLDHYSRDWMFSDEGRNHFLEPDLLPIPDYPEAAY
jgi:hypothetical protein